MKRYVKDRMLRQLAWPILLLLLVSTQVSAAECAVRCEGMASASLHGHRSGMAHCHEMEPSAAGTRLTVHADESCNTRICWSNTVLAQKQSQPESGTTTLAETGDAGPQIPDILFPGWTQSIYLLSARSYPHATAFDPLTASLRI